MNSSILCFAIGTAIAVISDGNHTLDFVSYSIFVLTLLNYRFGSRYIND